MPLTDWRNISNEIEKCQNIQEPQIGLQSQHKTLIMLICSKYFVSAGELKARTNTDGLICFLSAKLHHFKSGDL